MYPILENTPKYKTSFCADKTTKLKNDLFPNRFLGKETFKKAFAKKRMIPFFSIEK